MLTRNGYIVTDCDQSIKKELTVRAIENALGIQPASFKVFRAVSGSRLAVPKYYGTERIGPSIKDSRSPCAPAPNISFSGVLRDRTCQNTAFSAGSRAFSEKGGGVLSLPCGYGKSCMALAFSAHLKVRTMIVVHKEFLANQWCDKIKEFCPNATIGRVQGDIFDIEKDFVVALIQTMSQREFAQDAFDSIGFLVVDEAHHIGAPSFSQFMFKICPAYTLGLTATPERKDGLTRLLYWFLGPEFFRVNREHQKTTKVKTLHYNDNAFKESPPLTRFGKINMAGMTTLVTELECRNNLIVETVERAVNDGKRKVLVLSDRREHCVYLYKRFGSTAGLYIGGLKESVLEEASKKSIVVATFQLAHEGLDIPSLDTVVLATPKSDIKQSIGRIMRETPGKLNDPLIFDVADKWSVFCAMYKKRCAVYKEGGFEIDGVTQTEVTEPPAKCLFS